MHYCTDTQVKTRRHVPTYTTQSTSKQRRPCEILKANNAAPVKYRTDQTWNKKNKHKNKANYS